MIFKEMREKLRLKKAQKMVVIVKGGEAHMITEKPLNFFKGFLKGLDTLDLREDKDRPIHNQRCPL
jgi:hypothetical protein